MDKKGIFVTLEGPDGSGKSTLAAGLKEKFEGAGFDYILTREPGGTEIAEKIRDLILDTDNSEMDPSCEALLYAASRAQHTHELIIPSLNQGKLVLSDRYVLSSLAYQGAGRGLGMEAVADINRFATGGLVPDLVFFLNVDPITVLERKAKKVAQDRLERAGDEFHTRVYEGYLESIKYSDNVIILDGKQGPELIVDQAWQSIKKRMEV